MVIKEQPQLGGPKYQSKCGRGRRKRNVVNIDQSDDDGIISKTSNTVLDQIIHKAKSGIIAMKENDRKMPRGWYPAASKDLKSNLGYTNIDLKRYNIENKIRSIFRVEKLEHEEKHRHIRRLFPLKLQLLCLYQWSCGGCSQQWIFLNITYVYSIF